MTIQCSVFSDSSGRRSLPSYSGSTNFLIRCVVVLLVMSNDVWGQGLAISGVGAINLSMGGAATAAPIDAAGALHWNPATISGLWTSEISFGIGLAMPTEEVRSSVDFFGLSGSTRGEPGVSPIPHVAWVEKRNDSRWTRGLGVFGIGGFRSNYSSSLNNPVLMPVNLNPTQSNPFPGGVGRVFSEVELIQIVPTLSCAVNDQFSIGFAPTVTLAKLSLDPLLSAAPDDANGDGIRTYPSGRGNRTLWGGGFQVGLYFIGNGNWNWGAAVKSPQWFEQARFKTEDELGRPRTVKLDFNYPLIVSIGTAYKGFERWVLACDARYFNYGSTPGFEAEGFDSSGAVRGLGWSSIFAVSSGAQFEVNENLHTRLGYSYNQNPISSADVSFNVASPVISQHFIYLGGSRRFSRHSEFALTYMHAFENEVTGPIQTPGGAIPGSRVTSIVSLDALSAAMTVRY